MQKIKFKKWSKFGLHDASNPVPSFKTMPKWFLEMSRYTDGTKSARMTANSETNMSVKGCPPFLDSMLSGYMITLLGDVFVTKNKTESLDFLWKTELKLVSGHSPSQFDVDQIKEPYRKEAFKWINHWSISLPSGYSALFVHPLNRIDLPFLTLSGIVDCDQYSLPVNFPFLIDKNFEGVIPAGTPIAQIIPIKREVWKHDIEQYDDFFKDKNESSFFKTVFNSYKTNYWNRKEYR